MKKINQVLIKMIYKKGVASLNCVSASNMHQPKLSSKLNKYKKTK
ncbi:hypothetical protein [Anaerorhabdus furcosa]|nr:hypothetical protein [Anaerorhabdus furcosa]